MNLSQLKPPPGQKHKKRRLGQGMGTGRGKFSGRGAKGAKSISGYSRMRGFEGGQMPLHRRLPKRGFTNIFKKEWTTVSVEALERMFKAGDTVTLEALKNAGVKKTNKGVKVLGSGELKKALVVSAHQFTEGAKKKIEATGGRCEVVAR